MTVETAELFFALLAAIAAAIAVVLALPWVVRRLRAEIWDALEPLRLPLAAAITGTAMLGSLYFSEVANFTPCTLCWYQRILMYPSAIMLVIASFRRDIDVRRYVLPLTGFGMVVSTYHYLIERFPAELESDVCSATIPCSTIWFQKFGFVTLPLMALAGFAAATALLAIPKPDPMHDPMMHDSMMHDSMHDPMSTDSPEDLA